MKQYRKLIVATIALILLAGKEVAGLDFGFTADRIYVVVVLVAGTAGVWGVTNEN